VNFFSCLLTFQSLPFVRRMRMIHSSRFSILNYSHTHISMLPIVRSWYMLISLTQISTCYIVFCYVTTQWLCEIDSVCRNWKLTILRYLCSICQERELKSNKILSLGYLILRFPRNHRCIVTLYSKLVFTYLLIYLFIYLCTFILLFFRYFYW
jgi:hypothetical protein